MRSVPTIYDVAHAAGVSIGTVSYTLNQPGRVGTETRRRVLSVIDELGYVPHALAVQRARTKALRVGVIAPFTAYSSFSTRLQGVLRTFSGTHHEVLVYDHDSVSRIDAPRLAMLPVSGQLDGLIVMGIPLTDEIAARLLARRIPTVLVDSAHPEISSIVVDDEGGGRLAGRRLLCTPANGDMLYVSEGQVSRRYVSPGQRRMLGVVRAMADASLPADALRHLTVGPAPADAVDLGERLARAFPDGARIVAHHDGIAAGLVRGLRRGGRTVPDEFAVVGFDGGAIAEASGLTTVAQPLERSGIAGAELLIERMREPDQPVQHVTLAVELRDGDTA